MKKRDSRAWKAGQLMAAHARPVAPINAKTHDRTQRDVSSAARKSRDVRLSEMNRAKVNGEWLRRYCYANFCCWFLSSEIQFLAQHLGKRKCVGYSAPATLGIKQKKMSF